MSILKSTVQLKNSIYFNISELAFIPTREINEDVVETGIMINPIEVYVIDRGQAPRWGAGGAPYRLDGCVGKNYLVHKGNSRVRAAIQLNYSMIEGIILSDHKPLPEDIRYE